MDKFDVLVIGSARIAILASPWLKSSRITKGYSSLVLFHIL